MFPYPLISIDYNEDTSYIDDLELIETDEEICLLSKSGIKRDQLPSELKVLYAKGDIGLGIRAVSPMSYFEIFSNINLDSEFELRLSKENLSTSVHIDVVLYTKKNTNIQFRNIDVNIFGDLPDVDVPEKSFLGSIVDYKYWLYQERQRSIASVIKLNMEANYYGYELDSDKIHVFIPKNEVEKHEEIKENGDVIFGLYVFPVLVQAMAKVIDARRKINGDNEYNQYKWFDYLDMKIATLGLTESDPITACRELLEPNNVQNSIIAQLYESSH